MQDGLDTAPETPNAASSCLFRFVDRSRTPLLVTAFPSNGGLQHLLWEEAVSSFLLGMVHNVAG